MEIIEKFLDEKRVERNRLDATRSEIEDQIRDMDKVLDVINRLINPLVKKKRRKKAVSFVVSVDQVQNYIKRNKIKIVSQKRIQNDLKMPPPKVSQIFRFLVDSEWIEQPTRLNGVNRYRVPEVINSREAVVHAGNGLREGRRV